MDTRHGDDRTEETLRDSRFHRTALSAIPRTAFLVEEVEEMEMRLREARSGRGALEERCAERLADLMRAEHELGERLHSAELEVYQALGRDRDLGTYRAVFPQGVGGLDGLHGERLSRAALGLATVLRVALPAVAAEHAAGLERLVAASWGAERAWRQVGTAAALALREEEMARAALERRIEEDEGVLKVAYPGKRLAVLHHYRTAGPAEERPRAQAARRIPCLVD